MYTRASLTKQIGKIIDSFKIPGSKLRIVKATIVFSMAVSFPDIRQIIHMECLRLCPGDRETRTRQPVVRCYIFYKTGKWTGKEMTS